MARLRIYAFLIAIDEYTNNIRKLSGCVTGLLSMKEYLELHTSDDQYELRLYTLIDQEATRQAIISGFNFFKEACDRDICLFYFSGHGSFLPSPQFWESHNGYNQCILCANSSYVDGENDIIDKELSWLIYEVTRNKKVHFVSLVDCCFSGTITRAKTPRGIIKFTQGRLNARHIENYLGSERYIQDSNGQWSAPKGSHILFAACQSDQPAACIIVDGVYQSAFTYCLLKVLQSSRQIFTYLELENAVGLAINQYLPLHCQSPQISSIAGANINGLFLNKAVTLKRSLFIAWNERTQQWELNAGRLTGINDRSAIQFGNLISRLSSPKIAIQQILLDKTIVAGPGHALRKPFYLVSVRQYQDQLKALSLARVRDHTTKSLLESRFNSLHVLLSRDISNADFVVEELNGTLALCHSEGGRPLFLPVAKSDRSKYIDEFWIKAECLFRWQYILELNKASSTIAQTEYELELWRSEGKDWNVENEYEIVPDWRNPPSFQWKKVSGCPLAPGYKLKIRNTSKRVLYFSALHLSARFGIDSLSLPDGKLEPGKEAWLETTDENGDSYKTIGLTIDDAHHRAGIKEMTDYIKIIISNRRFSTLALNQAPLDLVPRDVTRAGDKDLIWPSSPGDFDKVGLIDWIATNIPIHIVKNI